MIVAVVVLVVFALMSSVVSFRMAPLRVGVARFPLAKRSFARSTSLNSCCTDSSPPIHSKEQFTIAYPDYVFDQRTQLVAPSAVGPEAIQELYTGLSQHQQLSRMYRVCTGSRWPFLSQTFLYMLPMAGMTYRVWEKEVLDKDGKEAWVVNESTGEVMSSRNTYYGVTYADHIKLVVQYRHHSLITDEAEFWAACAEGVRACEKNIFTAAKNDPNVAPESVRMLPVYVALTDWVNWRFMKIQDHVITSSPVITPFPVCKEGMKFNPDLATLLQYLCRACDITAQSGEDVKHLVESGNARLDEYCAKRSAETA